MGCLSELQELDLCDNQLTSLPVEIEQLPKRLNLKLDGNPLKSIPSELKQRFRL
ncbi:hypothetical protein [Neochlamydia sp. S13]|nr:hypothetical protein [Neochlamydia sp. S13]BBI17935.1 Predicted protein [Neochlamydia sp. S13]